MSTVKKYAYLTYLLILLGLGVLEFNKIIHITSYINWFIGILIAVQLFTTIPLSTYPFTTVKSIERLKNPVMKPLAFFSILVPAILFLILT
ncbi:hypothetical protein [Jeotgalibaca caeni]|uniref:hypothetical protein n=1 Tax=Jeotgalibaca caeni TaxID=3028623 RepID=UPI00237E668B|nr:hypothetical protein [Jeotgalibaca caeni]MDE1549214.1 hypothetical protein [Jeotgalibaca caeni]